MKLHGMNTERRYDIDWLRVIAIGLLLIYHIAIIFQPWALFIGFIRSEEPLEGLWRAMSMLNVWRIPLLFYVSGMGVYFALRKREWKALWLERGRRILIPFVFGILAISPLHMLVFQQYYSLPLSYYPHAGHLWFLGNILIYVLLLTPLFFWLKKNETGKVGRSISSLMRNPFGPLVIMLFFVMEVVLVKPQVFEMYVDTWHGFFLGLLAFLFGFLFVYSGSSFWETAKKWRWGYIGVAGVLYVIRLMVFQLKAPDYLMAIESNLWIFGWLGMGYKYLNRGSKTLTYLSQAAYPIYIIHMVALYLGGLIFLPLEIAVELKLISIIIFTSLFCLIGYELVIRRIKIIRPLFGLRFTTGENSSQSCSSS